MEKSEPPKKQKLRKSTTKNEDKTISLLLKNQINEERDLASNFSE